MSRLSDLSLTNKIILGVFITVIVALVIGIIVWNVIVYSTPSNSASESSEQSSESKEPIITENVIQISGDPTITGEVDAGAEGTCERNYIFSHNSWKTMRFVWVDSVNGEFSDSIIQQQNIQVNDSGSVVTLPYSNVLKLGKEGNYRIRVLGITYHCLFGGGSRFTSKLYKANSVNTLDRTLLASEQATNEGSQSGNMQGYTVTTNLKIDDILYILMYSGSQYINYHPIINIDSVVYK